MNLFKKFSAYHHVQPFSSVFGATRCAFRKDFFSPYEVAMTDMEPLLALVIAHGKNRFQNPEEGVRKLAKGRQRINSPAPHVGQKRQLGVGDVFGEQSGFGQIAG
ncbi:hypothetical protein HYR99_15135 [Candidatus Poribacteria bacterium]|nr:hypothetical protein [Candidatus Poribacteria bacterium]